MTITGLGMVVIGTLGLRWRAQEVKVMVTKSSRLTPREALEYTKSYSYRTRHHWSDILYPNQSYLSLYYSFY